MSLGRPDWNLYFMRLAAVTATRATCPRKQVGAIIVRDRRVLSAGYNGSIAGQPHCHEVGCMMVNDHCERVIHSEANAIVQAARNGVNIEGSTIYVTASPCWPCFKLIAGAGLKGIVFGEMYRDERIHEFAQQCKIELTDMTQTQRCGECGPCHAEKLGCDCDTAYNDGCFICTPQMNRRPPCPEDLLKVAQMAQSWRTPSWS